MPRKRGGFFCVICWVCWLWQLLRSCVGGLELSAAQGYTHHAHSIESTSHVDQCVLQLGRTDTARRQLCLCNALQWLFCRWRVQVMVDVYSESDPQKVDLILAYVTQQSTQSGAEGMGQILAHVAALPYKNAAPVRRAPGWNVVFRCCSMLPWWMTRLRSFGRVRFHLASLTPTKKYLAIVRAVTDFLFHFLSQSIYCYNACRPR